MECVPAFDRNAEDYDRWYHDGQGALIFKSEVKAVEALLPEGFGAEVGVGSGVFSSRLGIPLGLDPAPNMLRLSKKRGIDVICGTAEFIPIRSVCLDYILLVFTICFLKDPVVAFKEMGRVLRKGGNLILSFIPNGSSWAKLYEKKKEERHSLYSHARFYAFKEVREMLLESEFVITEGRATLRQSPLAFTKVEEPTDLLEPNSRYGLICIKATKIQS